MIQDPFRRFLGVRASAPPHELLGLADPAADAVAVETALRSQLERVYRHPAHRSPEAELVRRRLRAAAAALRAAGAATRGSEARPDGPRSSLRLGSFDRLVLAALVAEGGWNARSRGRIAALAGQHGVSPAGVLRVLRGLDEYARRGGPTLDAATIAGDETMPFAPRAWRGSPRSALDRVVARVAPEVVDGRPWSLAKLIVLAIMAIGLFGLIVIQAMLRQPTVAPRSPAGGDGTPPALVEGPPPAPAPAPSPTVRPAFARWPSAQGNAAPRASVEAADRAIQAPAELVRIAERIEMATDDELPPTAARAWDELVARIARGWVLVSPSVRAEIDVALRRVMLEIEGRPAVGDRLLDGLGALPVAIDGPTEVWEGAWRAGTLAAIAADPALPSLARDGAARRLVRAIGPGGAAATDFAGGAARALDRFAETLAQDTALGAATNDAWEAWLAAERELGGAERLQTALVDAALALLATPADPAREGALSGMLGRLLGGVVLDERATPAVRERLLGAFDDPERYDGNDLWVLTSLLATSAEAGWAGAERIVDPTLPVEARAAARRELADAWPRPARRIDAPEAELSIDFAAAARWRELATTALRLAPGSRDAERLAVATAWSWLNEAADAIVARRVDAIDSPLERVADALAAAADGPLDAWMLQRERAPRPRIAREPDGRWTALYESERSADERRRLVAELADRPGADLGPLDAETLVRLATRSPASVRKEARAVLRSTYADGPHVMLELFDQFPEAPRRDREFGGVVVEATNRVLPPVGSTGWARAARLALASRALETRDSAAVQPDAIAERLAESLAARRGVLLGLPTAPAAVALADEARRFAEALVEHAERLPAPRALQDRLDAIRRAADVRRRQVEGPGQSSVASLATAFEIALWLAERRQPARAAAFAAVRDATSRERRRERDVVGQIASDQRALVRMNLVRLAETADRPVLAAEVEATADRVPPSAPAGPVSARWVERLEALAPHDPAGYFMLAEEIVDAADDEGGRALARHLFALAGRLDPTRLARSACLALADLEPDDARRRTLLAAAQFLAEPPLVSLGRLGDAETVAPDAAIAASDALSYHRRGQGARAAELLDSREIEPLLDALDAALPGGLVRLREDCARLTGRLRPNLGDREIDRTLLVQAALLAGEDRTLAQDLALTGGRPLLDLDPDALDELLPADPSRPLHRLGAWTDR